MSEKKVSSMTLLEIRDAKTKLLEENDRIIDLAAAENRAETEEEAEIIEKNLEKVNRLILREANQRYKETPGEPVSRPHKRSKPQESFSMMEAIRNVCDKRQQPDFYRDLFNYAKKDFRAAGPSVNGDIVVPLETRTYSDVLSAGDATKGQEIVEEDKRSIIPPLTDRLVLAQAGATYLTGLVGDVSIPAYSGSNVAWKAEKGESHQGAGTFSEVLFSPKRLTAYIDVSKLFLQQDGVGAEKLLLDNIANAVARKLESTILGVGVGSANEPQGIGYDTVTAGAGTIAKANPSWATVVGMETTVDTANALQQNLGYITNSAGRGILKSTAKGSASDDIMLMEGNTMNSYPVYVTNSCSAIAGSDEGELLVFANWGDLMIAQWGGYDITVDPYSHSHLGYIRIVINSYFDAKGLRGSSGSNASLNNYITSFAKLVLE